MYSFLYGLLFLSITIASAAELKTSGYLKNYNLIQEEIDNDFLRIDRLYQTQNSGRFMMELFSGKQVWQLHYELGFEANSNFLEISQAIPERNNYRLSDIRSHIGPENSGPRDKKNSIFQNLDRINVQFQLEAFDLTIGRQAITFGSARVINPSDVFLPFNVQARNTEYRPGIDAIRFQKPLGQLGELDMGLILGKDGETENSAAFFQLQGNISGNDIQLAAMRFSQQNLIGAGIQTALGPMGFWLESAYVSGEQKYLRTSLGIDFAFSENIFALLEYHRNNAGSADPAEYLNLQNSVAYQSGGVFLLGKNYLIPAITWQLNALSSLALQSIYNLDDHSLFLNLSGNVSLSDNLYLGLSCYLFAGDDIFLSENIPIPELTFGSEYGGNPNIIFTSLSYYF